MTNLEDFFNRNKENNLSNMEEMNGYYGCQTCNLYTEKAYFDHKLLKIIWYCPQDHESSQQIG